MRKPQVLFVGDQHLGLRGAHPLFEREFERFLDQTLFPLIEEEKPLVIVLLGDMFDDRVRMHVRTMTLAKRFLDRLQETGIATFAILGNHDVNSRDFLRPNTVEPMLREYSRINAIHEPTSVKVADAEMLLVPWICRDNEADVYGAIAESKADLLAGHFDMIGFEQSPGVYSKHGIDPESLSKFRLVVSGHYHTWSKRDNVLYAGGPYQMTRSDAGQLKRIWLWDASNGQISSRVNPNEVFITVEPRAEWTVVDAESAMGDHDLVDKIVTIVAGEGVTDAVIDRLVELCERSDVNDVKVVDSRDAIAEIDAEELTEIQTAGTLELIGRHVDADPDIQEDDRARVKEILSIAYAEAVGGVRTSN
jgi:DNA repair exonuclease SbcCD nuclease subunit